MFIDSRKLAEDHRVEADICIIGAGAAGITMAMKLAGGQQNVCVIESGGLLHDDDTQALYDGHISGLPYTPLLAARVRRFGGTTNHWSGLCRPLDPIDFEKRDWIPHSGWPINYDDLSHYYALAQPYFGLDSTGFDVDNWSSLDQPKLDFNANKLISPIFRLSAPARFGTLYSKPLRDASNVNVYLHANATSIVPNSDVRQIESVQAQCLAGNKFQITAKVYVLATGGIENARLLLASQDVQSAGLGNAHDLVGRYFMDHPGVTSGILLMSDSTHNMGLYTGTSREVSLVAKIDGGSMEQFLSAEDKRILLSWIEHGASEDQYNRQVEPILRRKCITCHNPAGIAFDRTLQTYNEVMRVVNVGGQQGGDSSAQSRDVARHALAGISLSRREMISRRLTNYCALLEGAGGWSEALDGDTLWQSVSNVASNFGSLSKSFYRKYFNEDARRQLLRVVNIIEPSPNPNSRVSLNSDRDELGMNRVDLNWQINSSDRRTIVQAHEVLSAELGRSGLGRMLRELDADDTGWLEGVTHGWHHMGTTRMHDDEKQGVVDSNCRVHGLENLYIAGSSVFPTYGFAQPTLTIVALALRLTDHLLEKMP